MTYQRPEWAALLPSDEFMAGYEVGLLHGIERGRRELHAEWAALHAHAGEIARRMAEAGPYDVLADRRGQHDRAQQHRDTMQARGIIPPSAVA